jgi:hypothetical protein
MKEQVKKGVKMSCEFKDRMIDSLIDEVEAMPIGDVLQKINSKNFFEKVVTSELMPSSIEMSNFLRDLLVEQLFEERSI